MAAIPQTVEAPVPANPGSLRGVHFYGSAGVAIASDGRRLGTINIGGGITRARAETYLKWLVMEFDPPLELVKHGVIGVRRRSPYRPRLTLS
jgi:hypothetical protein